MNRVARESQRDASDYVNPTDVTLISVPTAANVSRSPHADSVTGQSSAIPNWSSADLLACEDRWRLDLTAGHGAVLAQAARLSDGGLHWQEYLRAPDLVELVHLRTRLTSLLWEQYGVALLRLGDHFSDDAMRLVLLLVGRALGRNVVPSVGGEPRALFAVTATDDPTIGGNYGGNGRNARLLALHTDGSGIHSGRVDVLSMLCIRPAREGGVSRLADARTAYLQLDEEARTLLSAPLPRTDPYAPGLRAERLICRPVFDQVPGRGNWALRFSYHPQRVRGGIRLRGEGAIAPSLERALSDLDSELERAAVDVSLGRGDILVVNNLVVAHGRTAFNDDPVYPRLIERLWVEVDPP